MFSLVSTRTPRSFSAKLLSSWVALSIYWCMGLFFPRCRTLQFSLLNFMRSLSTHFPSLSRSLLRDNPFYITLEPMRTANDGTPNVFVYVHLCCVWSWNIGWCVESRSGIGLPKQQPPLPSRNSSGRYWSTLSEGLQLLRLGILPLLSLALLIEYDYDQHGWVGP